MLGRQMVRPLLGVALVAMGCDLRRELVLDPSPATFAEPGAQAGVSALPATGPAPYDAVVRVTNSWQAAVPVTSASVSIGGSAMNLTMDAFGYGSVTLEDAGSYALGGSNVEGAAVHAVRSLWGGFALSPAHMSAGGASSAAYGMTDGTIVWQGASLWWMGGAVPPHQVLRAPAALRGVRVGNLDLDGVTDAVVWTTDTVVFLRGRPGGGMTMIGSLTAPGYLVGGAAIGDVSTDGLPDLVVAWAGSAEPSKLDVWEGDGLGAFAPAVPRSLVNLPYDVAIGDNTGEGKPQITVIDAEGHWERFLWARDQRYVGVGPSIELTITPNSTLQPGADLNGDGGDELIFEGPLNEAFPREVLVLDLVGIRPEFLVQSPLGGRTAYADLDQNGLLDVVMARSDGSVGSLAYNAVEFNYTSRNLLDVGGPGAIAASTLTEDLVPDLIHFGEERWAQANGLAPSAAAEFYWKHALPEVVDAGPATAGLIGRIAVDTNPADSEFVAMKDVNGELWAELWRIVPGAQAAVVSRAQLSADGAAPLDTAICGDTLWALMPTELVRIGFAAGQPGAGTTRSPLTGERVACGVGPDGAAVALRDGAELIWLDSVFTEISRESSSADDIAIVARESGPELVACTGEGCRVETWHFADGIERALVILDGEAELDGEPLSGVLRGTPSLVDVDGDGAEDLLALDGGIVQVHRATPDGVAPLEAFALWRDVGGVALAADRTGDGLPELLFIDDRGVLAATAASPLLELEEPVDTDLPQDTGAPPNETGLAETGAP